MEEKHLKGSWWTQLQKQSTVVKPSKLDDIGDTNYVERHRNHRSALNVKNTKDFYCVIWCILVLLYLRKADGFSICSCVQHVIAKNTNGINFDKYYNLKRQKVLWFCYFNKVITVQLKNCVLLLERKKEKFCVKKT